MDVMLVVVASMCLLAMPRSWWQVAVQRIVCCLDLPLKAGSSDEFERIVNVDSMNN